MPWALLLLVGTITFLWEVLKKISPDDVKGFRFFLTFVVVFVPLFVFISFGGCRDLRCDRITA
jgi:EamA domain-containing membrane protein RarD